MVSRPDDDDEDRGPGRAMSAVSALLATLELDEAGAVRAAVALALAGKLDEASVSNSGAVALALAGIAKELRSVVDAILEETTDDDEFVADIFRVPATVGDS